MPPAAAPTELTQQKNLSDTHTQDHPPLSTPLSNDIILDLVSLKWSLACVEWSENESRLSWWQTNGLHSNLSYDVSLQSGRRKKRNGAERMEKWQALAAKLDESQKCLFEHILFILLFSLFVMNEISFLSFLKITSRLQIHTVGFKSPRVKCFYCAFFLLQIIVMQHIINISIII